MATTDQDQFTELQFQVVEPTQDGGVTWLSGLWTQQEIIDYANQRQYRFMKDTLLMMAYARVAHSAGVGAGALPPDWIVTYRADWQDGNTGTITELSKTSSFEFDNGNPTWNTVTATRPIGFSDAESSTLSYFIMPAPTGPGTVLLLYTSLTAVLTGAGEIFTVPDEFVPAIKYGILADMLRKVGRGQDLDRADYCEARYQEGIEAAKLILSGWMD